MQYIKIHALDNVAVALADLAQGTEVSVDNQTVRLRQDVARGHKFALTNIAKGANVIKYGLPIGYCIGGYRGGGTRLRPQYAHESERFGSVSLSTYLQDLPAKRQIVKL
ncbi:UxaA family hydrolase [Shigella flexneri]